MDDKSTQIENEVGEKKIGLFVRLVGVINQILLYLVLKIHLLILLSLRIHLISDWN